MPLTFRPLVLLCLLALAAVPAAAQPRVGVRETVRGELTATDPTREYDAHYDSWQFTADADTTYLVRLGSSEFDAFVLAGPRSGDTCAPCGWDHDDGEGGAAVRVEAEAGATYVILASSELGGETGRYTLAVEVGVPEPEPEPAPATAAAAFDADTGSSYPRLFAFSGPESGVLEASDARDKQGVRYDPYLYWSRGNETVTFTLSSEAFAPLLRVGRYGNDCVWREVWRGEAASVGGESRLAVAFTEWGRYEVRASASGADRLGAYTISVVEEPVEEVVEDVVEEAEIILEEVVEEEGPDDEADDEDDRPPLPNIP